MKEIDAAVIENFNFNPSASTFEEIHQNNISRAYAFGLIYEEVKLDLEHPEVFDELIVEMIPYLEEVSVVETLMSEKDTLLDFVNRALNVVKLNKEEDIYLIAFILGRYCASCAKV